MTENVYGSKNVVQRTGIPVFDDWGSDGESLAISLEIQGVAVPTRREFRAQLDQLYDEHYGPVYRYLVLTGSSPADADDLLQEAFTRLLRLLLNGQRVEKPRNWLLRVCHNLRIDEARREERTSTIGQNSEERAFSEADPHLNPEAQMLEGERIARLRAAIAQLNKRQREFLLLRAEGLKLREIADLYGLSVQSVAESCARAIDKLGRLIHE